MHDAPERWFNCLAGAFEQIRPHSSNGRKAINNGLSKELLYRLE
jgi:hypothetical protein